jgi:hypothetical protein
MTLEVKVKEWLSELLELMTEKEIRSIARSIKVNVKGFQGIERAPLAMVNQAVEKKLARITELAKLFNQFFTSQEEEWLPGNDFEGFCRDVVGDGANQAKLLFLLLAQYPQWVDEHALTMRRNIEEKRHFLTDLVTLSDKPVIDPHHRWLQSPLVSGSGYAKLLNRMFAEEYEKHQELFESLQNGETYIFEWLRESSEQHYLLNIMALFNGFEQLQALSLHQQHMITEQTVFHFFQIMMNLNKETAEQAIEIEDLKKKLSQWREKKKTPEKVSTMEESAATQIAQLQQENEALRGQVAALQNSLDAAGATDAAQPPSTEPGAVGAVMQLIHERDGVRVVLFRERAELLPFIDANVFCHYHDEATFNQWVLDISDRDEPIKVIIDDEFISARQSKKIRQIVRAQKVSHFFISGSTRDVLRKIIFYAHGGAGHEK